MRSHPVFISFNKRWQLPIYFQLRWKDIAGKLEDTLGNTVISLNLVNVGKHVCCGSFEPTLNRCERAFYVSDASDRVCVGRYKFMLERRNLHPTFGASFLEIDPAGMNYSASII